jgi:hypothetical protein
VGAMEGKGLKRQLTSSKEPGRMGIRQFEKGTAISSKGISFLVYNMCP